MRVVALHRYPVKSVLGEDPGTVRVGPGGVEGDRVRALVDVATGRVVSAKQPRLWRALLTWRSRTGPAGPVLVLADGREVDTADPGAAAVLSAALGRRVRVAVRRRPGAEVERPDPEAVLAAGVEAEVPFALLEIAQATPGGTFVDHSPLHLVTTATLDAIGTAAARYRPNLVLATPPGTEPFVENSWVGRELAVGGVRLRLTIPTPRCAVPTLAHGDLPRLPAAVRVPLARNRVDVPGFGVLPCAGAYAEVVAGGEIAAGDAVTVG